VDIWTYRSAKSLHDLARDSLGVPVRQVLPLTADYSPGGKYADDLAT
jgi:hypothetical protein